MFDYYSDRNFMIKERWTSEVRGLCEEYQF